MKDMISFVQDGKIKTLSFNEVFTPTTTVLNYLRQSPCHKGVKEGCAEGDCGACTIVLGEIDSSNRMHYRAVDSCLVFMPMLQGKQLITVENLSFLNSRNEQILHPVQEAMVSCNGSQCGYCTPGIVMSLFALYKSGVTSSRKNAEDALTGNLCRCTGYQPILEAALLSCSKPKKDLISDDEEDIIALLQRIRALGKSVSIHTGNQDYDQPLNKAEALALRKQYPSAILISGATDVGLRVTKKHERLSPVLDISHVEELKHLEETETDVFIGAGLDLETLRIFSETRLPALFEALTVFGSRQIRTLATLGGNLGSASPIGDTLPVLMAYNADIQLESTEGKRLVNMNRFILGYRQTDLRSGELITGIRISKPGPDTHLRFYKVSKRKDLDISTVSACFHLELEHNKVKNIVLAYGGMAAVTKRAEEAETFLKGKSWNRREVEKAMALVEKAYTPLSDARSGAAFRSLAAKNLLLKFWTDTTT
ncbi:MAG TPA: xanthine dehydrogenase small subunit [Bacteroidia bacterium]|jgi:xanthine dehydrogenase small subunit|nr:xanthine dehydrogenase small subunit [Bacteroidia bacterium]